MFHGFLREEASSFCLPTYLSHLRHQFIKKFATNATITKLDLCWNNLDDDNVCEIAAILRTNTTLTNLNLSENPFSDIGHYALADALEVNTTLLHLNLEFTNEIANINTQSRFIEVFAKNATLITLKMGKKENAEFAPFLKQNCIALSKIYEAVIGLMAIRKFVVRGKATTAMTATMATTATTATMFGKIPREIVAEIAREMWRHKIDWVERKSAKRLI